MKKKEKEMQKILMDNFLKEVSTEIANIINSCEISKNFKNKISKRQLILFVFLTNKIWLMYSDILLKIMPEIKSKDELKKEVDEMIKTIIEEITE
jgi:predicted oxidoreductase (fatty acid repression mutant protein)